MNKDQGSRVVYDVCTPLAKFVNVVLKFFKFAYSAVVITRACVLLV